MMLRVFITIALAIVFGTFLHANPPSDTLRIKNHLTKITKTEGYRHYKDLETLNYVAAYIFDEFQKYADTVYYQEYLVQGNTYKNVIANFGSKHSKTVVVGAHYDACGAQEGADDNASGVVGLLELARLIAGKPLNYNLELVAYTLEEPPFFRSEDMGSFVHAKSLVERQVDVYGMLCLEMIGYFDEGKKTQDYPIGLFSLFYGNRGDYITLVNKYGKGKFARKFTREYKKGKFLKTKKFGGPKFIQGIDFSDHRNYWKFGISAVMLTDTAFYRNKNYHQKTDTLETLDLEKMAKVIDGVVEVLKNFKI